MNVYVKKLFSLTSQKCKKIVCFPVDLILFLKGWVFLDAKTKKMGFPIIQIIPFFSDRHMSAGSLDRHYFLQDMYMARQVRQNNPSMHYDIGSRIDGFISHLLCDNISVTLIDIRPLDVKIDNLFFKNADATNLEQIQDESIESLSTLHAIEHFGMGRYGDPLGVDSNIKAMKSISRVIKSGGYLYFSLPISNKNAMVYNSHRVHRPDFIVSIFEDFELLRFAHIHDFVIDEYEGEDAKRTIADNSFGEYDCGCFVFRKE